jgi:hypothetical protein
MKQPKLPLLLSFIFLTATLSAQQPSITGTLLDEQSGQPIPFATIGIKNQSIGVVSNLEGDFQIPLLYRERGDTLIISCIGYALKEQALSDLSADQPNIIRIQRADYALPEAVVRFKQRKQLSANQIVHRAIDKIPDNFPQSPFSYIGYYRDYQKRQGEYINLNEAIVEIVDQGFQTDNRFDTRMKLYNYLLNTDFAVNDSFSIAYDNASEKFVPNAQMTPFGGNELSILLMHDAVRNHGVHSYSFVNVFDTDFYHQHKFAMAEPTVIGDLILHCINFEGRRPFLGPAFDVEGKLYIESENYAIHKMEYRVYEREKEEGRRLLYDIQVEYAREEDRMFLNYISFNNLFYLAKPPIFRVEGIDLDTTHSYTGLADQNLRRTFLEVMLNRPPDKTSALDKSNYTIRLENRKVNIELITTGGGYSVRLYLNNEDIAPVVKDIDRWLPHLKIEFGEIYDLEQHLLNEPEYEEIRQYRELFRQKLTGTDNDKTNELPFMDRDTTLSANFNLLQPMAGTTEYWMNTPLKQ